MGKRFYNYLIFCVHVVHISVCVYVGVQMLVHVFNVEAKDRLGNLPLFSSPLFDLCAYLVCTFAGACAGQGLMFEVLLNPFSLQVLRRAHPELTYSASLSSWWAGLQVGYHTHPTVHGCWSSPLVPTLPWLHLHFWVGPWTYFPPVFLRQGLFVTLGLSLDQLLSKLNLLLPVLQLKEQSRALLRLTFKIKYILVINQFNDFVWVLGIWI